MDRTGRRAAGDARSFVRQSGRLSASLWKRVKWNGRVTVNGEEVHNARTPVSGGDRIVCEWEEASDIVPADIPFPSCTRTERSSS